MPTSEPIDDGTTSTRRKASPKQLAKKIQRMHNNEKREAGGLGEFLLCPQGKAASPRFMGVIVLGDVC